MTTEPAPHLTPERESPSPVGDEAGRSVSHPPVPRPARVLALVLLAAAVAVLVWGRGGTMVLLGVSLAFGALATLLLAVPDGDPGSDSGQ
jgi:hypothetical protein